jgi:hypothetical protein
MGIFGFERVSVYASFTSSAGHRRRSALLGRKFHALFVYVLLHLP